MTKPCSMCGETRSLSAFHLKSNGLHGRDSRCRDCANERRRQRYRSNPERANEQSRKWRTENLERARAAGRRIWLYQQYGLTTADYQHLLSQQDGVCAICARECPTGRNLAVDHDHATGHVRGLLCVRCNAGMGMLRDDPALLQGAITYLSGTIYADLLADAPVPPRDRKHATHLMRRYGISFGGYQNLLAEQGGGCAICGHAPPDGSRLVVDHHHGSGIVRGLLCIAHNSAIGFFGDDLEALLSAIDYLDRASSAA